MSSTPIPRRMKGRRECKEVYLGEGEGEGEGEVS